MDIKFIGTGGAFDHGYGNSSAWISIGNKNILLDCGHTVYSRLRELNLISQIDFFLITHCHDDHVGSLSTTILHLLFQEPSPKKAKILVPNSSFKKELYDFLSVSLVDPHAYVDFYPLDSFPGILAIDTQNLHVEGMQSFGFIFEDQTDIIVYSGDIGNTDIVFKSIPLNAGKRVRVFHDMSFEAKDGIHTYYKTLNKWVNKIELYAYHLNPQNEPDDNEVPLVINQSELLM